MISKPARTAALAGVVVLLAGYLAFTIYHESSDESPAVRQEATTHPSKPIPSSRPDLPSEANKSGSSASLSVLAEIRYTTDGRATYEKYKNFEDPTGATAYALEQVIDGCMTFDEKTVADLRNRGDKSNTPNALRRNALIENGVMRCKGFTGWGQQQMFAAGLALHEQALKAQYPAALAQQLKILGAPLPKRDENDATAKALLSGNIDADVIDGVSHYLALRNAGTAATKAVGADVQGAAWELLACNYGADCGESNRLVVATCLYRAICKDDLESVLTIHYPNLSQEKLREAVRMESVIGSHIQARDWPGLGF